MIEKKPFKIVPEQTRVRKFGPRHGKVERPGHAGPFQLRSRPRPEPDPARSPGCRAVRRWRNALAGTWNRRAGTQAAGQVSDSRKWMSMARAEWVMAPEETKPAPASA